MPNRKPKVLVVDDDPGMLDFVRDALSPHGFDVMPAGGGEQGLKIARREPVDLVIVDILMPGKDGLETIMELRRTQIFAKLIAMSGGGSFQLANALDWAEKMGAQRTLRKPFTSEELLRVVRETLGIAT